MNSKYPLISVITPFYNTEEYLSECIESVLAQTYDNYEYILVNNCSTDNSLEIAKKYSDVSKKIKIFNNDVFLSQVQNYNYALNLISPESEYCKVVQADDFIFPDSLRKMVEVAATNKKIGIVGSYWLEGDHVRGSGIPQEKTIISGKEICGWQLRNHPDISVFGNPTTIMVQSDWIRKRNPFYYDNSLVEDFEIYFEILNESDYAFIHQVLSFVRKDNDSITNKIKYYNPYLLHAMILLYKYGELYLSKYDLKIRRDIITWRYYNMLGEKYIDGIGRDFLEYHETGFNSIGMKISKYKLYKNIIKCLYNKTVSSLLIK